MKSCQPFPKNNEIGIRQLKTDFGEFEWYSKFAKDKRVTRFRCNLCKKPLFPKNEDDTDICFCFILKKCSLNRNLAPIVQEIEDWHHSDKANDLHKILENLKSDCFDVILPENYFNKLALEHPKDVMLLMENTDTDQCLGMRKTFDATAEMIRIIRQIEHSVLTDSCSSMYIDAKIRELLSLQLHKCRFSCASVCDNCIIRHRSKIEKARILLEQLYLHPPTVAELALQVGTNATVLKNGFRFFYNNTVYGYLFEYRMNIACNLLLESTTPIIKVAEQSGYEHQSHFSTAFKRKFGLSPLEFRKTNSGLVIENM